MPPINLKWRSGKERRLYRLPTAAEFQYAARAGNPDALYPWGKESPEGRANFDVNGTRDFGAWRKYLEPVGKHSPNTWGLYDMAGNVWQMVDAFPLPKPADYTYRLVNPASRERRIAGVEASNTGCHACLEVT